MGSIGSGSHLIDRPESSQVPDVEGWVEIEMRNDLGARPSRWLDLAVTLTWLRLDTIPESLRTVARDNDAWSQSPLGANPTPRTRLDCGVAERRRAGGVWNLCPLPGRSLGHGPGGGWGHHRSKWRVV